MHSVNRNPAMNLLADSRHTGYASRPVSTFTPRRRISVSYDGLDWTVWASQDGAGLISPMREFTDHESAVRHLTRLLDRHTRL